MNVDHAAFFEALAEFLQGGGLARSGDAAKDRERIFRLHNLIDHLNLSGMIEGILRFAEWNVITCEIVADAFGLIHDVDAVIFPFDIFFCRKIRIHGRFTKIHQTGNFLNRGM